MEANTRQPLIGSEETVFDPADEYAMPDYVEPSTNFLFHIERFETNPIIHREMQGLVGDAGVNINGPSLIRVPDWIENPLGNYYLYFAHHKGAYIRLAYADDLEGPWIIYEPGVLPLADTPGYASHPGDHLASPDVHIDQDRKQIRMYYHQRLSTENDFYWGQGTYVALSKDGLNFEAKPEILGLPYFRVYEYDGWSYAIAKHGRIGAVIYRSQNGLTDFSGIEEAPRGIPRVRHKALWKHNGMLYVFFSRLFDEPEHIYVSRIENLEDDWQDWRFTEPQSVLRPEEDYEGVNQPIERSEPGVTYEFVHQLRDPGIYEEDGRLFLLYSTAGERAIAIAELHFEDPISIP